MTQVKNIFSEDEMRFYEEIYRCESCSHLTYPDGVHPFAARDSHDGQTIPVSHFGNIKSALVWLLLTNPKGNRQDTNVGLEAQRFAANRGALNQEDILKIFEHFSNYDFRTSSSEFWEPWLSLLDDIKVGEKQLRFDSGGICAVDWIKCPTKTGWRSFVMEDEGKQVWANCDRFQEQIGHRYLKRQIELHKPLILIRPKSVLQGKGTSELLGEKVKELEYLIEAPSINYVKNVRCSSMRKCLTIEVSNTGSIKELSRDTKLRDRSRSTIQQIISKWIGVDM